jgi:hypothetical protein
VRAAERRAQIIFGFCDCLTGFDINTHEEEILTVYRELNEWYWVCNADGQMGWVPIKTVTRL